MPVSRARLALLGASALVLLAMVLMLRGMGADPGAPVVAEREPPRYRLEGVQWSRLDAQGRPLLRAEVGRVSYYDDESAHFESVSVQRLGDAGPWTLLAPQGVMPAGEQGIRLTRPVTMQGRLKSGDPVQILTDQLWVDLAGRNLQTDSPVTLTAPYRQARARGLLADWEGRRVELLNDVEVEYVPDPRG